MPITTESTFFRKSAFASLPLAALAALVPAGPVLAQKTPQAIYPLLIDQLDATNNYGPVVLAGNTTPPSPPANGVCVNGIYIYSSVPGGQDVKTPKILNLNANDFQVDVEFTIAALPANRAPVLMAGDSYRWIGIYVQANGIVGLKYNNSLFSWSTTTLATGTWYVASVKYEAGSAELILNGHIIHQAALGALNTGNNLNFTTSDFSSGLAHNGCIRNLAIWNDTTLGNAAGAVNYGSGCAGITMNANGNPSIGNAAFGLKVANVTASTPLVYIVMGQSIVDPGIDLTVIGMAGCFSYTSLDLGSLGPSVATGGVGTVPLPIPNLPGLAGVVLFTQGVCFTTATAFGLASSNATQLVLGL